MARTTEQILQQMLGNQAITIAQQGAHIESLVEKIKELEEANANAKIPSKELKLMAKEG